MKLIKESLFEEFINDIPGRISIEDFVEEIDIDKSHKSTVINWWKNNRSRFKIFYFSFKTSHPIMGCFLGKNSIAINKINYEYSVKSKMPPEIILYIALHESKHADQFLYGKFSKFYFEPVLNHDQAEFIKGYHRLEKEANTYAENSMKEMNYDKFIEIHGKHMRENENYFASDNVYNMMKKDIKKYEPYDFIDLLKKQIL